MTEITDIVAISWRMGQHTVVSSTTGHLIEKILVASGRMHEMEMTPGFYDAVGVFTRDEFQPLLFPDSDVGRWFDCLPDEVTFLLVHVSEDAEYVGSLN